MGTKIKMAVNWAGACGGCDVSLLDMEETILQLADIADIVYWPVAMDFKRDDLRALPDGSIDVVLFNGVVRTQEHLDDALLLRRKARVMIAYGACACFGGIPGMANLFDKKQIFDVVYHSTPSTANTAGTEPLPACAVEAGTLSLPEFFDNVMSLNQCVPVDCFIPGCPPTPERIGDAIAAIQQYAQSGQLPPQGAVIASEKPLCDECSRRETRDTRRIVTIQRPHLVATDEKVCFLNQGLICLGPFTRGGCGSSCISANMPCRGCFGPTAGMLDPGAEALSSLGCIVGAGEDDLPPPRIKTIVNDIVDPVGTVYRFTLPSSLFHRALSDEPTHQE